MRRAGQTVRGRHRHEQSGQALLPSPRGRDPTDMAKSTSQRVSCFENSVKLSSQFTLSSLIPKVKFIPHCVVLKVIKKKVPFPVLCTKGATHWGGGGVPKDSVPVRCSLEKYHLERAAEGSVVESPPWGEWLVVIRACLSQIMLSNAQVDYLA